MGYRQADPAWRTVEIMLDPKQRYTLGRVGCLVTSLAEARRRQGDDACTPVELLRRGLTARAFSGPNAHLERLAACAGLDAPAKERVFQSVGGAAALRETLARSLAPPDKLAVLHVTRLRAPGAPPARGVHFVLGVALTGDVITYADPATGAEHALSLATLEGPAGWGLARGPIFRVVSVAPVRARLAGPAGCALPG